ncbi:type II toxin-antitoxin system HicB family antitoxin [Verminephrobacter aporrectodeae subsp. tuberculatae]|nr:type II toxin-antitoxin system HicB family antitoxin [Verminephrobacter aporrectodeae]MCW5255319.1 type II toxin-antitoxin system HicB family antitoxin [Verminephrobacter aporrectodeae subsp. tuberculatae]
MKFPVTLTPDEADGGFVVTFPDIPEAITQGETAGQALVMAQDALETAMEFYFEDKRAVPVPSKPGRGQPVVALPASVSAKVLLLNEMVQQHIRPAELARRLNTTPQKA